MNKIYSFYFKNVSRKISFIVPFVILSLVYLLQLVGSFSVSALIFRSPFDVSLQPQIVASNFSGSILFMIFICLVAYLGVFQNTKKDNTDILLTSRGYSLKQFYWAKWLLFITYVLPVTLVPFIILTIIQLAAFQTSYASENIGIFALLFASSLTVVICLVIFTVFFHHFLPKKNSRASKPVLILLILSTIFLYIFHSLMVIVSTISNMGFNNRFSYVTTTSQKHKYVYKQNNITKAISVIEKVDNVINPFAWMEQLHKAIVYKNDKFTVRKSIKSILGKEELIFQNNYTFNTQRIKELEEKFKNDSKAIEVSNFIQKSVVNISNNEQLNKPEKQNYQLATIKGLNNLMKANIAFTDFVLNNPEVTQINYLRSIEYGTNDENTLKISYEGIDKQQHTYSIDLSLPQYSFTESNYFSAINNYLDNNIESNIVYSIALYKKIIETANITLSNKENYKTNPINLLITSDPDVNKVSYYIKVINGNDFEAEVETTNWIMYLNIASLLTIVIISASVIPFIYKKKDII